MHSLAAGLGAMLVGEEPQHGHVSRMARKIIISMDDDDDNKEKSAAEAEILMSKAGQGPGHLKDKMVRARHAAPAPDPHAPTPLLSPPLPPTPLSSTGAFKDVLRHSRQLPVDHHPIVRPPRLMASSPIIPCTEPLLVLACWRQDPTGPCFNNITFPGNVDSNTSVVNMQQFHSAYNRF